MIDGLVLAAGGGRRFGGAKLVAVLDDRPLLDHALDSIREAPEIGRVVVVLGADAERVMAAADLDGVETVVCEDWAEGIAASLRAGVEALAGAEAVLITLGDQPLITAQVIAAIADRVEASPPAARATYDGRPGHPVLIKRELFDRLRALRGDAGARDLLTEVGVEEVECGHLCRPADVDTREDLEAMRRELADGALR